jgi:hypothetical protein
MKLSPPTLSFLLVGSLAAAQSPTLVEPLRDQAIVAGQPTAGAMRLWKVGCLAGAQDLDASELQALVDASKAIAAAAQGFGLEHQGGSSALTSFDLQLSVSSPPAGASAAVTAVEAFFEARLGSTHATGPVLLAVNFGPLGPTTAMTTATNHVQVTYASLRPVCEFFADPDDAAQRFLPATSTLPVRFDGSSATVTDCTNVYVGVPTLAATIPGVLGLTGPYATITVNSRSRGTTTRRTASRRGPCASSRRSRTSSDTRSGSTPTST